MPILIPTAPLARTYVDAFNTAGSSPQQITGVGFKPKAVIFFARAINGAQHARSWGMDNGVGARCTFIEGDTQYVRGDYDDSVFIYLNSSNFLEGHISSMDADGFTMTWSLGGTVFAEVNFIAFE